jgi:glycosyltransferase involved in cell wall biosynthesis
MTPRSATSPLGTPENPIKIMRIIARLNIGGPAIHVSLLAAGMNSGGFSSQLVTGHIGAGEGDMSYLAVDKGVAPIYINGLGREISWRDDLTALWALIRLIAREKPHVVHTHTAKAGFLGRLAAWVCRVPVIVHTFHGHTFHGYFGPLKTRIFIFLEQVAGRMSTIILTISDRLCEDLDRYKIAPRDKIQVIPLGLDLDWLSDLDAVRGQLRRQLRIDRATPLVGIVGRLVPIKNHDLFLRAASKVIAQDARVRFVVVGDGELRGQLEDRVREFGLGGHVDFIGWRRDLREVYADLDILALTSDNEGTPVSIIEAMAGCVPVVTTAVGGIPDLLERGEFGQLVAAGGADPFASAILDRLQAGRDEKQLDRARMAALERYGSQRLIADLEKLYLQLLVKAHIRVDGEAV